MTGKNAAEREAYLTALCHCIPYHIVEEVLANPSESAFEPSVFDGSVLVLDLVGFSATCERLAVAGRASLSRLSRALDELFTAIELQAVFPHRGYVVQFAGDAMLCVFRDEEHEARCVATALTIQQMMEDPAFCERSPEPGQPMLLRMGISTGRVYLHVVGDIGRRAVICAGATAHQAIRRQLGAEPGEIIADRALLERLGDRLELVTDKEGDTVSIGGLVDWPATHEIEKLEGRIEQRVDEKISLLEPFVPAPMIKRLRSMPRGWQLQGEIRRAVIQFVDIEGLAEKREHLELASNLARSQFRALRKYDGVMLKVVCTDVGHRMMVLYGLQRPSENDAEHALLASLEGITRLKAFAGGLGMELKTRVGVHIGDLYLGAIGSYLKHDLTAVGDAVNVTVRLTESAEPFQVVASDEVIQSVADRFKHSQRDAVRVKGKTTPMEAHVVHDPAPGHAHYTQRRSAQRLYAGRADQVQRLREIVERTLEGRGRIIGITGEAGIGKSHLLADVIDRWVGGGGIGVVGRCRYATRSVPLAPVIDMFSTYFGVTPSDSEATRIDRIRARLTDLDLTEGTMEFMSLFQPVNRPDGLQETLIDLADLHARERVLDTIVSFVEHRLSQVKPLYVLEDVHLADTLTLQLIQRIGSLTRNRSYLFIATYRPEEMLNSMRESLDEELALENLTDADLAALVCHEMGAHSVDPQLKEFLWRRTRGNPQHLVELARFLADRLLVNLRGGAVVPAEPGLPFLEDVVPDRWHHVALARLDGLNELERRLLRAASAIGSQFDVELLDQAVSLEGSEGLIDEALTRLEIQRVISAERGERQGYRFRDENIRAIAYSLIPEVERREVHQRIADALESRIEHLPRGSAASLAHHRERASQWEEAARWYEEGLQVAVEATMDREACYMADRWEYAIAKLPLEKQPDEETAARVAVRKLLAVSRHRPVPETLKLCQQIEERHHHVLSASRRRLVELVLGTAEASLGRARQAKKRLRSVFENEESSDQLKCDAAYMSALLRYCMADLQSARAWIERGRTLLHDDEYRETFFRLLEGDLLLIEGQFERSSQIFDEVRDKAQKQGRPKVVARAMRSMGNHALLTEEFDRARRCLHYALTLDRRTGSWITEAEDVLLLGQVHLWNRDYVAARPHLERSMVLASDIGHELIRASALTNLGALIALSEDPKEGQRMCVEGHQLAIQYNLKHVQMVACLHLLHIAIFRQDREATDRLLGLCEEFESLISAPLHRQTLLDLKRRSSRIS